MNIFKKTCLALGLPIICALCAINASAQVVGPSAFQYSLLPETMIAPPDQTPNIMLILDTSGSMREDSTNTFADPGGANEDNSRSARVREGIIAALKEIRSANIAVNLGLATFGNSGLIGTSVFLADGASVIADCHGYVSTCAANQPADEHLFFRDLTGFGTILQGLSSLTEDRMTEIETLFAREPRLPEFADAESNGFITDFFDGYFGVAEGINTTTDNGNLLYNGTLISQGGTPLRGSLATIGKFYTGLPSNPSGDELPSTGTLTLPTPLSQIVGGATDQCAPNTYIFLLTDGLPTVNTDGDVVASVSDEVDLVAAEALRLRTNFDIQTWVFGFELDADGETFMGTIADGGSATQDAFLSSSADALKNQIVSAILAIDSTTASASGISVVASQSEGAGLVVQALFDPTIEKDVTVINGSGVPVVEEQLVSWTGSLNGVFIDDLGFLREDSDGDAILDDYSTDIAFRMVFNDFTSQVDVERLSIAPDLTETVTSTVSLDDLNSIWNADEVLGSYSDNSLYGSDQRPYSSVANNTDGYRHIFSWMANDPNNFETLHLGSQIDFIFNDDETTASINAKNFLMFDPRSTNVADQKSEVEEIVRFIRGEEGIFGLRSRSLGTEKFLLGDIVHSNAAQVGAPNSGFDFQNDDSYTAFKETYQNRRRMVYVGANDGMLHGFNAGFWDSENKQFHESPHIAGELGTPHELGAEIWAYVPMNLLPHLKFLTESSYASNLHVAYMDGPVQSFDVRAWSDSDIEHVNGWGTIIVAGMRFGGGDYADLDSDATDDTNALFTSRSGYVILDVTDPERQPKVIAEVIHPNMGFSLSAPSVSRSNCTSTDGDIECDWHLVIGSGPTELATATSDQLPHVFRFKLEDGAWGFENYTVSPGVTESFKTFGTDNAFTGDMTTVDWNSDFEDDVVYFGSISGTELAAGGGVHRLELNGVNANTITNLIDVGNPVPYQPVARRQAGKDWILFGTGRFLTIDDSTNKEQNWFYGVIEPRDSTTGELDYPSTLDQSAELVDVTGIEINFRSSANTTASEDLAGTFSPAVEGTSSFNDLKAYILDESSAKNRGWYKRLDDIPADAIGSRKTSASALTFRNLLFYTDYEPPIPDSNACNNEFGTSFLNVVDISTGTASFTNVAGFEGPLGLRTDENGDETDIIQTTVELGSGFASQSFLFPRTNTGTGRPELLIKTPLSTGAIKDTVLALPPQSGGRTSWRELEIQ